MNRTIFVPVYGMRDLTNKVSITAFVLLVGFALTAQTTAFATNDPNLVLTPHSNHSAAWNSGYSHGYLGDNLTGTHTKAYFFGYLNGSSDFWYNKGYACGVSGKIATKIPPSPLPIKKTFCDGNYGTYYTKGKQFRSGNTTGWTNRISMLASQYNNDDRDHLLQIVLPVNTTDGYKQYFVGFSNGIQFYENRQSMPGPFINAFTIPCNGTAEYCTGFKAGWNEDEYNQD